MEYEQNKSDQRLAYILSAIWPGMGLIYLSKKGSGMIFVIIHVLAILWILRTVFYIMTDYNLNEGHDINFGLHLMFSIVIVIFNWTFSMTATNNKETDG